MASKSALRRDPSKPPTGGGLTQSLRRVSPGIYRNAGGQLTNQAGRPMPQQPNRPPPQQQWQPGNGQMGQINDQMHRMTPEDMQRFGQYTGDNNTMETVRNVMGQNPNMVNLPAQLPPGANPYDYGAAIAGYDNAAGQIHDAMWRSPGYTDMMYRPPGYNQNAGQMPQPSANNGGKYRLSPGVYGTREQAMRQYTQQMQQPGASAPQQQQRGSIQDIRSKLIR